jgi:hypothetical protein
VPKVESGRVSGKMTNPVTAQTLWEGSWLALEQAGRLLRSASILWDSGDPSTAVAIAMLGREELGRSRLLRQPWTRTRGHFSALL